MRQGTGGIERQAFRSALVATAFVSALALVAGGVRVLPLLLDPELPWEVAAPFARAVAWLALEVAVAVGWPIGWALAFAAFVDRGEARVHALLGRSPSEVVARLAPQAAIFGALLFTLSWLAARDAERPGRVLGELLESSRATCVAADSPRSIPVPFLDARWLCSGDTRGVPRLLLRPPRPNGAIVTATRATLSGDVREIHLEDVHVHVARGDLAVRELWVRGLPPLLTSASIRPLGRALAVLGAALGVAFGVALMVLRQRIRHGLLALTLAAFSMGAAFGVLRLVDRAGGREALLLLVPLSGVALLAITSAGLGRLSACLRRNKAAATTR